jgi:ATP-dependent Lon protease
MSKSEEPSYDPLEPFQSPLPDRIPVMAVKSTVLFPTNATGLQVSFPPNVEVLSLNPGLTSMVVAMVATEDEDIPIDPRSLEKVAVAARVLNRLNLPGGTIQATLQGMIRIRLEQVRFEGGHYTALPRLVEEARLEDEEEEARLIERILATLNAIGSKVERLADVPRILRRNTGDASRFADLVATMAHFSVTDRDEVLQRLDLRDRLRFVQERLDAEWERIRELPEAPAPPPAEGRAVRRPDQPSEIRKQIAALQAELGEMDPSEREAVNALRRIDQADLPSRVASVARREAERLRTISPASSEAADIQGYIEALLSVPWERSSETGPVELEAVRVALDRKHLGLEEVKRRILEILSVALLRGKVTGLVPCIVGPPGVGKRSLAAAVAGGLGRPLTRIELGGRGESQLIGSRRGRAGAQPGKLIGGYRECGVRDPVFLLEELDEIGIGKVEGDPIEAMEEFLDPANRDNFVDRYLEIPFDLSDTVFIATAQDFNRIPRSLREYLIEIRIAGYTPEEKVEIAREQMLPRLIAEHGLGPDELRFDGDALLYLMRGYARDSGLGSMRRALSSILRYVAHRKATGDGGPGPWTLSVEMIEEVLGIPRYSTTEAETAPEIGVVTGLAWTASGGELMFIEALKMPGTGRLIITGLLGEVMRESVSAAYSYVRSQADLLGIANSAFGDHDIHVHFPVGATPKDGPSAGAAVTLAIASSLADRSVRHDIAMTGEVTLRGKILDIGGVKEKILAAYRAGLREVVLPSGNERDLRDVPDDVREGMTFHLVSQMDEVFELALLPKGETGPRRRARSAVAVERGARAASEQNDGGEQDEAPNGARNG